MVLCLPKGYPDTEHLTFRNVQNDDLVALGCQPHKPDVAGQKHMEPPDGLPLIENHCSASRTTRFRQIKHLSQLLRVKSTERRHSAKRGFLGYFHLIFQNG